MVQPSDHYNPIPDLTASVNGKVSIDTEDVTSSNSGLSGELTFE
jgi:hypothetical protein